MTWLLPLAIIIPLAAAGLTLVASRRPRIQRIISVGALAIQLVVELVMLLQVSATGPFVMHVGGWTAPFGITVVADQLAAFMLVVPPRCRWPCWSTRSHRAWRTNPRPRKPRCRSSI